MNKIFHIATAFVFAFFACACAPKTNPVETLPETTWQPVYVKGASNLKISKDKIYIHFEKNLELEIMGGAYPVKSDTELSRKKLKRSECHFKATLKPIAVSPQTKNTKSEFLEFQNLFIKDLLSADAIRVNANKLEFLKGKKLQVELKRIPNNLGKNKKSASK